MRLAVLVLAAALLAQEADPAAKIRPLIEQMQSDSVVEADDAFNRLVALGPDVLPAVKAMLDKVPPDVKARLTAAAAKIERQVRAREAIGAPVRVTLQASKRAPAEVLEELKRVSGQPLVWGELPSEPVSVELQGGTFWAALEAVCAAHGGMTWDVVGKEIRVSRGKHRKRPLAVSGNLAVIVERVESTEHVQDAGTTIPASYVTARLVWTAGRGPRDARFSVEVLKDDLGNSLIGDRGEDEQDEEFYRGGDDLAGDFQFGGGAAAADEAKSIAELSGAVRVQYVVEWKQVLSVDEPVKKGGTRHKSEPWTFQIESIAAKGDRIDASVVVTWSGEDGLPFGYEDFAVVDDAGKRHPGRAQDRGMFSVVEGGEENTEYFMLSFELPAGAKAAKLELRTPGDLEDLKIPFSFKGIPLP